jgi:O-antigen/teichoic acid export membrane protein
MLISTYFLVKHVRWRPSLPSLLAVRPLLRYSGYSTVNSTLNFFTGRVDNMLVGALLGTGLLGLYNRAYSLARMPVDKFATNLAPVMFGSLSRIQEDLDRSRRLYFKATSAITALTMPFLVVLLCVGPETVEFVYGNQWTNAGLPLQLMVPGAFLLMVNSSLRSVINAQGLVSQVIPINLTVLGVTVVGILVLFPFGLVGIAIAISVREAISLALIIRLLSRSQIAIRAREVGFATAPSFIAGGFALVVALLVMAVMTDKWSGLGTLLLVTGTVVFSAYLGAMTALMFLWREHEYLMSTRSLIATTLTEFAKRLRPRPADRQDASRGSVQSTARHS